MQHWILRCKHCNKEYIYCTYGNGSEYGTEEGCSKEYCAECQKAIDKALSAIPKKFEPRLKEIDNTDLFPIFDELKKKQNEKILGTLWPSLIRLEPEETDFDVVETYYYKNNLYKVKYYNDSPDDKHIYVSTEYDLINNRFTDKKWRYINEDSCNIIQRNWMKSMRQMLKEVEPMDMAEHSGGEFFFMEPMWNVEIKDREN